MKVGDKVLIKGIVDEIRKDVVIIKNEGGYFGTMPSQIVVLPKGYGRLIDADEVVKEICIEYKVNSIYELPNELWSFIKKYLNEAPTILKPTVEYMIKNYGFSKSEEE